MLRSSFPQLGTEPSTPHTMGSHRWSAVLLLSVLVACGNKDGKLDNLAGVLDEQETADGLVQQKIDLNSDGQPDIFNYYKERKDAPRLLVRGVARRASRGARRD